jgi:hypothetical protein
MKSLISRTLATLASLKLTIVCLAAATLLVFAGTLAQVRFGIQIVQEQYFQSMFVWWSPVAGSGFRIPVFPGGHLIGAVLVINLLAASTQRWSWAWRKTGIKLIHAGLIIMFVGALMTDLFSVESYMRLDEGQTKNYSEERDKFELAVADSSDPEFERVTAIPAERLRAGHLVSAPELPFQILVKESHRNSKLLGIEHAEPGKAAAASQGVGARVQMTGQPVATGPKERNVTSAVIEILPLPAGDETAGASLGTWLVSDMLASVQTFECGGKKWSIALRPRRHYKPFSLTLHDFTHERYPGTRIPKNFSSRVTLSDPGKGVEREALIYMNHPLRYGGETFYQSGFDRNDQTSILQVVRNPSFAAPYVACVLVGLGLTLQFTLHLIKFSRRRKEANAS